MLNSTLLTLLRLLEPAETALLDELIDTALFKLPNRHRDAADLFRYLIPLAPAFDDDEQLDKYFVAKRLFGHRAAPAAELRKAMSNLVGILKKFVLTQQVVQTRTSPDSEFLRQLQSDLSLLRWLTQRSTDVSNLSKETLLALKNNNQISKTRSLVERQYENMRVVTTALHTEHIHSFDQRMYSEWLLLGFWQEYELYDYFGRQRTVQEQQAHMIQALSALDQFYLQLKMSLVVHLQTNLLVFPGKTDTFAEMENQIDTAHHLIQHLSGPVAANPAIAVYIAAFRMLYQSNDGEAAYQEMNQIIQSGQLDLPDELMQTLREIQQTYCAVLYNRTKSSHFLQRRFDLSKIELEIHLKKSGNTIDATRLSSTIVNALFLGASNYQWVATLLQHFQQGNGILATETPREVYKINRAHLLLYEGAFREASNELVGYEWYSRVDDPQVLLLAVRIDLKIQYELGRYEDEYTLRTFDTAEKRITRLAGIDEQLRAMTLHFLRIVRQLCTVRTKLGIRLIPDDLNEKTDTWEKEILSEPIAEKAWLLQKISDIRAFLK